LMVKTFRVSSKLFENIEIQKLVGDHKQQTQPTTNRTTCENNTPLVQRRQLLWRPQTFIRKITIRFLAVEGMLMRLL
jgi:hypothetical protein